MPKNPLHLLNQPLSQLAECQEIEAALRNSQEQLALILDGVPALIAYIDADLRYQYVNKAYAEWHGRPVEAFIGQPLKAFLDASTYQTNLKYYDHVLLQGQRISFEHCLRHQDGRLRTVKVDLVPHLDAQGSVKAFLGLFYDITELKWGEEELIRSRQHLEDVVTQRTAELSRSNTQLTQAIAERKRVEQAVRAREYQYRLLAHKVTQGIALIQPERLVFANEALLTLLGYAPDQLPVNWRQSEDFARLEIVARFFRECQEMLNENRESGGKKSARPKSRQILCTTRQGREIWTERQYHRIEWGGEPAILVMVENITRQKQQEQEMQAAQAMLQRERQALRAALKNSTRFGEMIGKSPAMQEVYQAILNAAASDANTIIYGESGTGKELAAQTIHQMSERKHKPFVVVNCGAIPENLFEREFFGHRKGAFTGADTPQAGYFDAAQGGTLFLDEIGELTPAQQVKLLRVLENREYMPVGDNQSKKSDVRIIAATNKNLAEQRQKGLLRDDFFYRIHVITLTLPPLRERKEDIPLLIAHFLKRRSNGHKPPRLPDVILEAMSNYHWPGNIRELQNELQRYLVVRTLEFLKQPPPEPLHSAAAVHQQSQAGLHEALAVYEKQVIATILAQNNGNTTHTAQILGLPLRTLQRKIKNYHLAKHASSQPLYRHPM